MKMLLIMTSREDPEFRAFDAEPRCACVTPEDLSKEGWRLDCPAGPDVVVITSRGPVDAGRLSAAFMRFGSVGERCLMHIHPDDRNYVAAEQTAFLAAFLHELRCPLFNPPSATWLMGPPWTREHWLRLAHANRIRICSSTCDIESCAASPVFLCHACIDTDGASRAMIEAGRKLLELARVPWAQVHLCTRHGGVIDVSLRPPLAPNMQSILAAFEPIPPQP